MRYFLAAMFAAVVATVPLSAEAALVNCGTRANPSPCTICHLVQGGVGLMDWGLTIMTAIGVVVIVAMAIMYIVSAGDEGLMQTAKGGIKAAIIGFAVMLSAWLIVHTTLRIFGANNLTGYQQGSNVFSFQCSVVSSSNAPQGAAPVQNTGPIVNNAPINSASRTAPVVDAVIPDDLVVPAGSFLASVSTSGNGSALPAYKTIQSGQTAQFQIVPDGGTGKIVSVTGCGGSLSGDIYTTGPITAACTITATFSGGTVTPIADDGGSTGPVSGGNVGDPGSGMWYPDSSNNKLLVADPPTGTGGSEIANGIMYIPGCVGAYNDGGQTGCRVSPRTPSGGIGGNFALSQGNTLSIRLQAYANSSSITGGAWLGIHGSDGGGTLSSVSIWLVADPRTSYASAPSGCKSTDSSGPRVLTMPSQCTVTAGQTYYLNIRVNDGNKCGPKPIGVAYYSGDCNLQLENSSRTLK